MSHLSQLIDTEHDSSAYHLFRVTELVHKFIYCLCNHVSNNTPGAPTGTLSTSLFDQTRVYWIKDCQSHLQDNCWITLWKHDLDLSMDDLSDWRCGGRMSNSWLSLSAKNPVLPDKSHHLSYLLVMVWCSTVPVQQGETVVCPRGAQGARAPPPSQVMRLYANYLLSIISMFLYPTFLLHEYAIATPT